jgi:dihydrofolate synthase / folylpolyglutamate synthase
MKVFTYEQAVKFLDESLIFGIKPDLLRINKILERIGDPHKDPGIDFIHVVGTNGKTSTTILTARILDSHGLRSAYHTSPHIDAYTERFWFCGRFISKSEFAELFTEVYPYIKEINYEDLGGPITQFEIIAAMGFLLCRREEIEVMVLEAGLGGRWDATNAAHSKVVGFTGVSLEHTSVLGNTVRKIAIEKSMVIKEDAMVATTSKDGRVIDVLKKRVSETNSRLFLYGDDFYMESSRKLFLEGWSVSVKTVSGELKDVYLPLIGNYQPYNFTLAAVLSELYLSLKNRKISADNVKKGVAGTRVIGRFEILHREPFVIADTSHNPEGLDNFFENLRENFGRRNSGHEPVRVKKIIIFSVLKDKDYRKMLATSTENADILILTSSNTARSLHPDDIEKELKAIIKKTAQKLQYPEKIYKLDSVANSLKFALKIADSNDIICITGSITNLEGIL